MATISTYSDREICFADQPAIDTFEAITLHHSLDSFLDWNHDDNDQTLTEADLRSFGIWK